MGRMEYWDPVTQSRKPAKAGSIVDNTGLEYSPSDVKAIETEISSHKAEYAIQIATGAANAITVVTGGNFKYTQGNKISFKAISNSSSAVTVNIDNKGNKPLKKLDGTNAATKANKVYEIYYSVGDDCFFLLASAEGDAVAGNVLAGKTFSNDDDSGLVGTMPNRISHVSGQSVTRSGTTIRIRPQQGHYSGESGNSVQYTDPDFIASNILENKEIFGLTGTLVKGKKYAQGSVSLSNPNWNLSVSGLDFAPTIVIVVTSTSNGYTGFAAIGGGLNVRASSGASIGLSGINLTANGFGLATNGTISIVGGGRFNWVAFE